MNDTASFGYWVRRQRKALDLTQPQLAQLVGCAVITIRKIEQDERRPSRPMAERLADCLAIPTSQRADFVAAGLGEQPVDKLPLPQQPAAAPPHNLPHYFNSFVGRIEETAYLQQQLPGQRLITLTGPGGSGKTRLAVHLAWQCVHTALFPGGIWLAELAKLSDPGQLLPRLAALLAVPVTVEQPLPETIANHLHNQSVLLLLDNCEHLLESCAHLTERLLRLCPQLVIITTSREPLRVNGEMRYPVLPLPFPDTAWREPGTTPEMWYQYAAIALFCERAAAANPHFRLTVSNMAAVAVICRYLDGIPLALELAAANIAQFTPAEIAARLPQALRYLTGGSRTAPTRQQTLQATIEWSYQFLSPEARELLPRLALFHGGWTQAAAQFVSQMDAATFFCGHAELVDKSLVAVRPAVEEQSRYDLLEMIRQFAGEKLDAAGERAAAQAHHFTYYQQLLQQTEQGWGVPDCKEPVEPLAAEQGNLRAALLWAEQTNQAGFALFAAALGRLWYRQAVARLDQQAAASPEAAARLQPAREQLLAAAATLARLVMVTTL